MRKIIAFSLMCLLLMTLGSGQAALYGKHFCKEPGITCIKIKRGQSWLKLWPDPYERDVVKRLNRLNTPLYPGMTIAVPNNLVGLKANDIAPFVPRIQPQGVKTIIISPFVLAWGAYDSDGRLVKWGPISAGKDYCEDIESPCHSRTGTFTIFEKRGPECFSTKFPVDEGGGAPMPYCMFYSDGFALHGSPEVPGYNASHGCIRLFTEDARWLNTQFTADNGPTKVIVLPYDNDDPEADAEAE